MTYFKRRGWNVLREDDTAHLPSMACFSFTFQGCCWPASLNIYFSLSVMLYFPGSLCRIVTLYCGNSDVLPRRTRSLLRIKCWWVFLFYISRLLSFVMLAYFNLIDICVEVASRVCITLHYIKSNILCKTPCRIVGRVFCVKVTCTGKASSVSSCISLAKNK
jgi:hypothetical protein